MKSVITIHTTRDFFSLLITGGDQIILGFKIPEQNYLLPKREQCKLFCSLLGNDFVTEILLLSSFSVKNGSIRTSLFIPLFLLLERFNFTGL